LRYPCYVEPGGVAVKKAWSLAKHMGPWTPRQEFESPPGYQTLEFHILIPLFS
jgi:hypothetical protein